MSLVRISDTFSPCRTSNQSPVGDQSKPPPDEPSSANGVPAMRRDGGDPVGTHTGGRLGEGVEEGTETVDVGRAVVAGVAVGTTVEGGRVDAGAAVATVGESVIVADGVENAGLADGWAEEQPTRAVSDAPTKSRRANVRADPLTNSPLGCSPLIGRCR
jgi:hypothetical protein